LVIQWTATKFDRVADEAGRTAASIFMIVLSIGQGEARHPGEVPGGYWSDPHEAAVGAEHPGFARIVSL
jgi:hypothetical protein